MDVCSLLTLYGVNNMLIYPNEFNFYAIVWLLHKLLINGIIHRIGLEVVNLTTQN